MRSKLLRRFGLPATVLALAALVFAMSVQAGARGGSTNDEVTVVNLSGGPVGTTAPFEEVTIPLNGAPSYTFTQKAGQAIELIATADVDESGGTFCEWNVIVYGDKLQARVDGGTERGEVGEGSDVGGLAAPAVDTEVTIQAFIREMEGCDQDFPEEPGNGPDTITVSLRVSVVTLRN